ncbi:MAG: ATPase AAA [Rhodospirillaceae bacterium BRH_c57]|nr:MAG: ATPase AAA [Rhodospirillaceae bacterium BRH_c57]
MGRNPIETIMGAVVLVVAGLFLAFAYDTADIKSISGYPVTAAFSKVGGLDDGADVRISGIKVGSVSQQNLDPKTYQAIVHMTILPSVLLPQDTVASVASDGLLGGKYIKLEPGRAEQAIAAGGTVTRTRNYQSVEDLVGEIIFLVSQDEQSGPSSAPTME